MKNNDRRRDHRRRKSKEEQFGDMEGIRSTELGSASRLPLMCPVPCPPLPTFVASAKRERKKETGEQPPT